jgi:DNA-binding transcriptional ArsR family regulator
MKAGEIVSHFHNDTQPGISRHLKVLRESGLVEARYQGRENHYCLNPVPLVEARDGWLGTFGRAHTERLSALREAAEATGPADAKANRPASLEAGRCGDCGEIGN